MTAVVEVDEQYAQKFQQFIKSMPKNAIKLTWIKHNLDAEIKRRIHAIDSGEEALTPYAKGMDEIRNKLQFKYGNI